ncbi:MAG: ABC transporter permease [Cellvibrionaceae bacterium]
MSQVTALFWARTKEYYRDKGSLIWSFVMPPLIIAVVALAFSREDAALFKVGLYPDQPAPEALVELPYIQWVPFSDLAKAEQKVRHHQIDLLLVTDGSHRRLFNPESKNAQVLQDLLVSKTPDQSSWIDEAVSGRQVRYVDWVIPGILGMNLMFSGLFGVGYVIVRYRKNGVLKRLQAAPVSPYSFLAAQMLSRLVIMMLVSALVYGICNLFLDFLMLGNYFTLALIALVGNVCLLSLGLIVASRMANEELANGLLNFLTFPMLLLSEVWFSLDGAPQWMAQVSNLLPLTHMVQAAREVMIEGATLMEVSDHLVAMVIMTLVFLALAARIFKWRSE